MRPYVIINCASSLDGKISLAEKKPLKISNEEDEKRVHHLRNECDAILVGIETVLADDPKLTVKEKYVKNPKNPIRVVLDSKFRLPENASLLKQEGKTIVATTCKEFKKGNLEVIKCGNDRVDIVKLMEILYEKGVRKLLVEGGARVITEFLKKGIVDEMQIFFSPIFIGKNATSLIDEIQEIIRMEIKEIKRIGDGFLVILQRHGQ
ncbi:MAG: 2,5-diamino-6-(ribosylamino)-4(3H)-pyrimidinone 5'-phosphate reductase [Thermoplasmatales archaeon]|nr:2,5-diamino-6-(ribosylamino)-4(3H)-pyrimidinone 5'-phosphate reductase [Thermoplasmatales archaeon]